jgi:MFS family permease
MSAGADDPELAAGRVSVISSIGYCAFLGGPPLIGFLGDHVGVVRAVAAPAALLVLAALISPVVGERPARPDPDVEEGGAASAGVSPPDAGCRPARRRG